MREKLNTILLIDDDEATNFIHDMVIKQADVTKNIVAVQSGKDALDFLTRRTEGEYQKPELIFLDINMPGMNGWEFLEAYKKLDDEQKGGIVTVMLTTSLNPDDEEKANSFNTVKSFLHKPLSIEMIHRVMRENFPDKV